MHTKAVLELKNSSFGNKASKLTKFSNKFIINEYSLCQSKTVTRIL